MAGVTASTTPASSSRPTMPPVGTYPQCPGNQSVAVVRPEPAAHDLLEARHRHVALAAHERPPAVRPEAAVGVALLPRPAAIGAEPALAAAGIEGAAACHDGH